MAKNKVKDKSVYHDFLIGDYTRLDRISVVTLFGIVIYERIGIWATLFGYCFIIEK